MLRDLRGRVSGVLDQVGVPDLVAVGVALSCVVAGILQLAFGVPARTISNVFGATDALIWSVFLALAGTFVLSCHVLRQRAYETGGLVCLSGALGFYAALVICDGGISTTFGGLLCLTLSLALALRAHHLSKGRDR